MNGITINISDETLEALATIIVAKLNGKANGKATYTVAEAAKIIGTSQETIRRRVEAGTLPRVPGIGRTLIPAVVIERLINPPA